MSIYALLENHYYVIFCECLTLSYVELSRCNIISYRGGVYLQGGFPGCPGNHLFVVKYLIWLNKNIILFDIFFIKGLVKGRFTNENNKS